MPRKFDYLSPEGFRIDGRRAEETRKMDCGLGNIHGADGSCYVHMGNTKIIGMLYGPKEPSDRATRDPQTAVVVVNITHSFNSHKIQMKHDTKAKEMETFVRKTLESALELQNYPRTVIETEFVVFEEDGDTLAAILNAAFLVTAHAGLTMQKCFSACGVALVKDAVLVDPNTLEETSHSPCLTAVSTVDGELLGSILGSGTVHTDTLMKMIEHAQEAAAKTIAPLKKTLAAYLGQKGLSPWSSS
ncbi:MAG: exosome complex component RRP41 [Amphiamblys sp. WSBS2006]|nr:MAG: exosome complex component RRP41 [Amphiamblys sp. WSBS2006]